MARIIASTRPRRSPGTPSIPSARQGLPASPRRGASRSPGCRSSTPTGGRQAHRFRPGPTGSRPRVLTLAERHGAAFRPIHRARPSTSPFRDWAWRWRKGSIVPKRWRTAGWSGRRRDCIAPALLPDGSRAKRKPRCRGRVPRLAGQPMPARGWLAGAALTGREMVRGARSRPPPCPCWSPRARSRTRPDQPIR